MTKIQDPICLGDYSELSKAYEARGCEACNVIDLCVRETARKTPPEPLRTLDALAGIDLQAPASSYQVGGDHYKEMGIEPWDVIDAWPLAEKIGYYRGNALKYLMRMGEKDGQDTATEVAKARHYCDKLIEVLEDR